jgi:ATP-binding cassette, subfamily B, multidrug efflux pump
MTELYQDNEILKKNPLLYYVRHNKRSFALGILFLVVTNSLDGVYPLILKQCIDLVSERASHSQIADTAFLFFLVMSGLAITRYLWRVYFGRYHTDAAEDLRNRIFYHLSKMGPSFFKKHPVGEIISVLINDVQSFRQAIGQGVLVFIDGIVIAIVILPLMIWLNPSWTWKTLVLLPLVPFMIKKLTQMIFTTFKTQQDKLAELSGVSQEIAAGVRVIKSFAQEDNRLNYYNQYSSSYEKSCNRTAAWDSLFMPVMEFGVASGSVILLFIGAEDVLMGTATIGTLVAFQRYISKMVWPMTALGLGYSQFQKGMASFSRIKKVLDQVTDIPDSGVEEIRKFEKLEVKNLSFQYPDGNSRVLDGVSFTIQAGQLVGIVGPVGSGKTTLLHLLTRLYPASPESIFINDLSIEKIQQKNLHDQIVMVPQEAFLFSEMISENMGYGLSQAPEKPELAHWARAVDIDSEINELPSGYDSQLGERGVNLSGGQKQRLTIARALITRAPVVMLDDSLSAVDVGTEAKIKNSVSELTGEKKTRIIVAHRLTTVENADQIIVMNEGKIEAIGRHRELINTSATYRNMAQIQGYEL